MSDYLIHNIMEANKIAINEKINQKNEIYKAFSFDPDFYCFGLNGSEIDLFTAIKMTIKGEKIDFYYNLK